MNETSEAFVRGGLIGWAGMFLLEVALFLANETTPLSAIPTLLMFLVGGFVGLAVVRFHQWARGGMKSAAGKGDVPGGGASFSYEEWKRF